MYDWDLVFSKQSIKSKELFCKKLKSKVFTSNVTGKAFWKEKKIYEWWGLQLHYIQPFLLLLVWFRPERVKVLGKQWKRETDVSTSKGKPKRLFSSFLLYNISIILYLTLEKKRFRLIFKIKRMRSKSESSKCIWIDLWYEIDDDLNGIIIIIIIVERDL